MNSDHAIKKLESFRSIRSPFMRWTLHLLPWAILLTIPLIIANYGANASIVMYVTGLLTAALSLFAFRLLMKKIPQAFSTIWDRKIIVECEPASQDIARDKDFADNREPRKDSQYVEMKYLEFIRKLEDWMNSPFQMVTGLFFSLFVLTWDYSSKAEFLIAFIIGIMAWKMTVTAIYVWKLGKDFCIEPQLGHADKCGGLSPLGELCLWNAIIVTIPAIYLGSWIIVGMITEPLTSYFLQSEEYASLFSWLLFVPVLFALIAFFLPLRSTHQLMLRWRDKKRSQLDHLEQYIYRLECRILEEAESMNEKEYECLFRERELMEQLYRQSRMIPVWPFNTGIITRLLLSQSIPFFGIFTHVLSLIKRLP
ncbi:hypothetical protein [Methanolobus sp. WCC5]|jgi:hypothetical protein|uniref:hypothetical protein n=1 Tax=Methanolobus sp. WCC5 TaxID=3125785 RepID=UPI0032511271